MKISINSGGNPWVSFSDVGCGQVVRMKTAQDTILTETMFMKIKFEGSHSSTFSLVDLNTGVVVQPHITSQSTFQAASVVELNAKI
ncbi:hypothetical protein pSalSNUABM01_116 [Salmonella phage pSal-SNUABM-01]|nr:hypothetical protein pSalSNUABM01_116 [Salmonella phage pSal-SNUABM-01]